MLTESFIAATEAVKPPAAHLASALKDVGIFIHEFQPQPALRQGYKKSSVVENCLAVSRDHVFAAQAGKAVVNVYNRAKGNQEATVPFPQKITCLAYAERSAILILGTQDGKLMLWEIATGRVSTSLASHIEAVTHLVVSLDHETVVSASSDSIVHVWSIRDLVSIGKNQDSFGKQASKNDPIATFSQHRSPIKAVVVGHSQHAATNFVVSVAQDNTCYIWNLATLQILCTVLLPEEPTCATIDPADRAVYVGILGGGVQMIDLFDEQNHKSSSILSNTSKGGTTPRALPPTQSFRFTYGPDLGFIKCITINYDGTRLLTGHESGKVLQWDIAKRRMTGELSGLSGQPVTNIQMLHPTGFATTGPKYTINSITKPRLELSMSTSGQGNTAASSAIPVDYTINLQVRENRRTRTPDDIDLAITSSQIPQSMLDAAVQSLIHKRVASEESKQSSTLTNADLHRLDTMQQEIASLKSQLANHQKIDQERFDQHLARMKRREEVGLRKREAFFAAKKQGKDGDEAMKPFMQLEKEIDAESDEEVIAQSAAGNKAEVGEQRADVEMEQ